MNTTVNGAGPGQGTTPYTAAPGSGIPGSTMAVGTTALVFLGVSVAGLVGLRMAFGKGVALPPMRVDVSETAKVFLAYQAINIPLTLIAYKYHGHKFAQTYLLFT
jgi:uncharacterized membrane-anchored protein YitT (DUF2179 family)